MIVPVKNDCLDLIFMDGNGKSMEEEEEEQLDPIQIEDEGRR